MAQSGGRSTYILVLKRCSSTLLTSAHTNTITHHIPEGHNPQ